MRDRNSTYPRDPLALHRIPLPGSWRAVACARAQTCVRPTVAWPAAARPSTAIWHTEADPCAAVAWPYLARGAGSSGLWPTGARPTARVQVAAPLGAWGVGDVGDRADDLERDGQCEDDVAHCVARDVHCCGCSLHGIGSARARASVDCARSGSRSRRGWQKDSPSCRTSAQRALPPEGDCPNPMGTATSMRGRSESASSTVGA